jgi:hypothetical protein
MINDMGIQVFDEAPAAEDLLMSEAPAPVATRMPSKEAEAGAVLGRIRIRPHHRPGAHVHARDGHRSSC